MMSFFLLVLQERIDIYIHGTIQELRIRKFLYVGWMREMQVVQLMKKKIIVKQ